MKQFPFRKFITAISKNFFTVKAATLELFKWAGTISIILAAGCRAAEFHTADLILSILGAMLWGYASVIMRDKPLLAINAFIIVILIAGLLL